jgi:hypothetical protein
MICYYLEGFAKPIHLKLSSRVQYFSGCGDPHTLGDCHITLITFAPFAMTQGFAKVST